MVKEPVRPLVSATLIVRDEEKFLGGCLASLRGVMDEIVVVDTGSTDRTKEIAHAHGVEYSTMPGVMIFRRHGTSRLTGHMANGFFISMPMSAFADMIAARWSAS